MTTLVALLSVWLFGSVASQDCTTTCPSGHLAVCVRSDSDCRCACATDTAKGIGKMRTLLQGFGASQETIQEATRRFKELAKESPGIVSFSVKDGNVIYYISGRRE